jgi:hypothetical protein
MGADHRYVPLLMTGPGFGWITSFTVASELGDITRFSSPTKLIGYTGLCPRVSQSGDVDLRGRISKRGPRYLRWGLMEAAIHAAPHQLYKERYRHDQAPPRPPTRRQGRSDRRRPPARRSDLVHRAGTSLSFNSARSTSKRGYSSATWNFGDGSQTAFGDAALTPATHVYRRSGRYTVTLTLVDTRGNLQTTSRQVIAHRRRT